MEKQEYEDDTIPKHVVNFLKARNEEKVVRVIERKERRHLDDDESRERENGQTFVGINLFT